MTDHIVKPKQHPAYHSWRNMRNRCLNPRGQDFHYYGGRGISICPEWDDFWVFAKDMGERPEGYTIDRIDNDGNYCPENCRWASRAEQAANKRDYKNARLLTLNGRTQSQNKWATELGMAPTTIYLRLRAGWPVERALTPQSHGIP
jgi:hypothetical protein